MQGIFVLFAIIIIFVVAKIVTDWNPHPREEDDILGEETHTTY